MGSINIRQQARLKRKNRIRKKIHGTPDRPRLSVFRSARHTYAQIIDDLAGVTLASASSLAKPMRSSIKYGGNKDAAKTVGTAIAKQAMDIGVKAICFDRNGYRYHGRVKALADGAREGGLVF